MKPGLLKLANKSDFNIQVSTYIHIYRLEIVFLPFVADLATHIYTIYFY